METVEQLVVSGTTWVSPKLIHPNHEVRLFPKFERLVADMRARGWCGRPLVANDLGDGFYQAWVGAHRLAASLKAPLDLVPVFLVNMDKQQNALYRMMGVWVGERIEANPVHHLLMMDEELPPSLLELP